MHTLHTSHSAHCKHSTAPTLCWPLYIPDYSLPHTKHSYLENDSVKIFGVSRMRIYILVQSDNKSVLSSTTICRRERYSPLGPKLWFALQVSITKTFITVLIINRRFFFHIFFYFKYDFFMTF